MSGNILLLCKMACAHNCHNVTYMHMRYIAIKWSCIAYCMYVAVLICISFLGLHSLVCCLKLLALHWQSDSSCIPGCCFICKNEDVCVCHWNDHNCMTIVNIKGKLVSMWRLDLVTSCQYHCLGPYLRFIVSSITMSTNV